MCCFAMRIIVLILVIFLSFMLSKFYQMPLVFFYLILINIASFIISTIFFKFSPKNMKISAIYYFSVVGGVFGVLFASVFTKFSAKFLVVNLVILSIWIIFGITLFQNFDSFLEISRDFLK